MSLKMIKRGLTFDDVLLVPQYSDLKSRSEADLSTRLLPDGSMDLQVPIISANMDTITGTTMATQMWMLGGAGILHRYAEGHEIASWIHRLTINMMDTIIPSIGVGPDDYDKALTYMDMGATAICIDIAHGDSVAMCEMISKLKKAGIDNIIAGNVATPEAAIRLQDAGAAVIKVGIGPGSLCTTRVVTGHGVPQLTAIMEVSAALKHATIIADGGIRNSGDIVKALAAGADAVMIGSLLAGTEATPSFREDGRAAERGIVREDRKVAYRGMASRDAQVGWKGKVSNDAPEGEVVYVEPKGPVKKVIDELVGGIRSGMSYSGARNLSELRAKAVWMEVTAATVKENGPHGKP